MKICFQSWVFIVAFILSACGASPTPEPPVPTPPAIGVQITKGNCPSIEIQPDMQITWTNLDDVDRLLIVEHVDENGVVRASGGTDLLQPGDTFSLLLNESGQYTYFCSKDRKEFGIIKVLEVPAHK